MHPALKIPEIVGCIVAHVQAAEPSVEETGTAAHIEAQITVQKNLAHSALVNKLFYLEAQPLLWKKPIDTQDAKPALLHRVLRQCTPERREHLAGYVTEAASICSRGLGREKLGRVDLDDVKFPALTTLHVRLQAPRNSGWAIEYIDAPELASLHLSSLYQVYPILDSIHHPEFHTMRYDEWTDILSNVADLYPNIKSLTLPADAAIDKKFFDSFLLRMTKLENVHGGFARVVRDERVLATQRLLAVAASLTRRRN